MFLINRILFLRFLNEELYIRFYWYVRIQSPQFTIKMHHLKVTIKAGFCWSVLFVKWNSEIKRIFCNALNWTSTFAGGALSSRVTLIFIDSREIGDVGMRSKIPYDTFRIKMIPITFSSAPKRYRYPRGNRSPEKFKTGRLEDLFYHTRLIHLYRLQI